MKKLTFLLLIACFLAGTTARAQTITYHKKNASLRELLKVIVAQTGYGHIFKGETLERVKRVDISADNAPLRKVLDDFFQDQPLTYTIVGKVISIQPKTPSPTDLTLVTGRITNQRNEPVPGATITVKGSTRAAACNDDGEFMIREVSKMATLVVTSINYESQEVNLDGQPMVHVQLKPKSTELVEVSVVATGYQNLEKETSPGSYTKINNELLNRRVSTNVLDRLDDVTPGMILNKNVSTGTNQSSRSIRGRSTIFSNAEPLIVVDNFPYPGDPGNINPNDVESITILKDANAAAIWGAFSGNGVIVITTKKGRYRQTPQLALNNNITIGDKLDAWYPPALGVNEYIALEQDLFDKGYYDLAITDPAHQALSPVVEELDKRRNGLITQAELEQQLDFYSRQDTRREIDKYFYRNSINQQYAISTSGGGVNNTYYLSAGFDKNQHNLVGNKSQRVTLTANNTYAWFKNRLELSTGVAFAEMRGTVNNGNNPLVFYPYLQFIDNGQFVHIPYQHSQSYIESLDGNPIYSGLLDWNFNPVQEIQNADNTSKLTDYRINAGLKYKVTKALTANLLYQFNKGSLDQNNIRSTATYFTRDMINRFSQIESNAIIYEVPNNTIAEINREDYEAQNVRAQLNYVHSWIDNRETSHYISALAGVEVRDISGEYNFKRLYGYDPVNSPMGIPVNDSTLFPMLYGPVFDQIPNPSYFRKTSDRYVSYYMTAAYTLQERYTLSVSARKDESNLFGVETNKKGVPLFSIGAAWDISKEKFYDSHWLPYLKFRATHGYNGNVNKSVSAYVSGFLGSNPINIYREPYGSLINPPNPFLRWEKVRITNFGLDFKLAKEIVTGSIEYYMKRGTDLIGNVPLDPSTGFPQIRNNSAAMSGSGIDVMLSTTNINKRLRWNTIVIFNHNVDKVTSYKVQQNSIAGYYNPDLINPVEDKPLYSIYSLKWMGLDPQNGDPRGLYEGQISKDYVALRSSKNLDDLVYNGPANPTYFGSVRNDISWKQFSLSFNITWKAGHYFRRSSIEYADLLAGRSLGHTDYNRRWQAPGDEQKTYIPSINYMSDPNRDLFFKFSEVLVEKGDLIRFQDVRLSYDLQKQNLKKLPIQKMSFYLYANNLGLLWKATQYDIDPDYVSGYPNPRSLSVGVTMEF